MYAADTLDVLLDALVRDLETLFNEGLEAASLLFIIFSRLIAAPFPRALDCLGFDPEQGYPPEGGAAGNQG